ncbi:MAG: signal recognition particle-docking protein FtsY [Fusobacteriaceae bacterium]
MGFFDKLFKRKKTDTDKEMEIKELLDEAKNQHEEIDEDLESEDRFIDVELDSEEIDEKEERESLESLENKDVEEDAEDEPVQKIEVKDKKSFFASLKDKLFNSRNGFFGKLAQFFTGKTVIDDEMYNELEELLVQSDIGLDMSLKIISTLEKEVKIRGIKEPTEVYPILKDVMENFLITEDNNIKIENGKMNVILVVGVNGVGKTTTIGKIASKYVKDGKKVIIGAGDTFRAAAVEQVEEWAKRAGAEIVKPVKEGGDPGAVVFDTLKIAEEREADVVIIDTAGRLHNKNNLMAELEKINNIIKKRIGDQFYESLLVIDGTTGQNALAQAKVFNEVTKLTGFIVTKLDGTAKGGVLFSISEEIKKPIKFIGVGEKVEDLREFDVKEYIEAIFG